MCYVFCLCDFNPTNDKQRVSRMYVYRFLDKSKKVIYVGQTHNIEERIINHIKSGHLPLECYEQVDEVEYLTVNSKAEADIVEVYFINLYKPAYNSLDKSKEPLKVKLNGYGRWKPYKYASLTLAFELGCKCRRLEAVNKTSKDITRSFPTEPKGNSISVNIDAVWLGKANSYISYINSVLKKDIGASKPNSNVLRFADIIANNILYANRSFISVNKNTSILIEFTSPIKLRITDRTHYITEGESDIYYYTIGSLEDIDNPGSFTLRGVLPYLLFTPK